MSPSLRQRLFSKAKDSPPETSNNAVEMVESTPATSDTAHTNPSALPPPPSDSDREHSSSLNTTLTSNHRVPFYRRRANKSETALSSSTTKSLPRRRRTRPSFLSRVVHKVVPCVPETPQTPPANDERENSTDEEPLPPLPPTLIIPPIQKDDPPPSSSDSDIIVPPPPAAQLLPTEETDGLTSGAVQPPGSTGEPIARIPTRDSENSDGTSYMEDDGGEDMQVFDEQAEEERLIRNGGAGIPVGPDGLPRPLLPPLAPEHVGRKCLVLDLDETLVHSSFKAVPNADFVVPVEIEYTWHHFHVLKRPGVDDFLKRMGEHYEIVIYTASLSKYADPVLDKLDIHRVVNHRLFRESCFNHKGNYVKDLSQLGRPIADTIILDNSPASYIFHPHNAVPVSSWFNDPHDAELMDLVPFLIDLKSVGDVRGILNLAH